MMSTPTPLSRTEAKAALEEGRAAFDDNQVREDCPYSVAGPPEERLRRYSWMQGWDEVAAARATTKATAGR